MPFAMARGSLPLRLFGCFAAVGYLCTVLLVFLPLDWHLPMAFGVVLCPSCLLFATEDVSRLTVLLVLGVLNAALYGVIGFALGKLLSLGVNE